MFTPPPSPQPSRTSHIFVPIPPTERHNPDIFCGPQKSDNTKQRTGRRFLWAVTLAPLILITLTVYAGFSTSLVQTSSLGSPPPSWHGFVSNQSRWKREPEPQATASPTSPLISSGSSTPTSTTSSLVPAASQVLPTIPSSSPPLPTPFPQAFDGILTQNFSSPSCLNFFTNMTASMDFRQCRPFSFLFQTSSTFINAQSNLTLMNTLIWGTCNTTLSYSQCQANMASFASLLQSACPQELTNQNLLVVNSLISLRAFQVMHDSACLVDPTTNAYCYLSAVQNPNPSDYFFFSIPLGIPLPKTVTPSCSACSESIMGIYSTALQDRSQALLLTALKSAYQTSAQLAVQLCGAPFARTLAGAAMSLSCGWPTILTGSIVTLTWAVLTHVT